ncbi:hypothetical protein FB45DRAFT_1023088 [Roridomyces roridus]|uniref:CCHC-type domain-containing protein n=1 Tax=Roridomyces roridus TaxID=1738132 RepID=A0AAD7FUJ0_9AGAR|nr:hypothetical protein FB45DRAFT_1023088 [Roridomyces roridus]
MSYRRGSDPITPGGSSFLTRASDPNQRARRQSALYQHVLTLTPPRYSNPSPVFSVHGRNPGSTLAPLPELLQTYPQSQYPSSSAGFDAPALPPADFSGARVPVATLGTGEHFMHSFLDQGNAAPAPQGNPGHGGKGGHSGGPSGGPSGSGGSSSPSGHATPSQPSPLNSEQFFVQTIEVFRDALLLFTSSQPIAPRSTRSNLKAPDTEYTNTLAGIKQVARQVDARHWKREWERLRWGTDGGNDSGNIQDYAASPQSSDSDLADLPEPSSPSSDSSSLPDQMDDSEDLSPEVPDDQESNDLCTFCGESGHMAPDCFMRLGDTQGNTADPAVPSPST